jgi:hypothetical protein
VADCHAAGADCHPGGLLGSLPLALAHGADEATDLAAGTVCLGDPGPVQGCAEVYECRTQCADCDCAQLSPGIGAVVAAATDTACSPPSDYEPRGGMDPVPDWCPELLSACLG